MRTATDSTIHNAIQWYIVVIQQYLPDWIALWIVESVAVRIYLWILKNAFMQDSPS